MISYRSIQANLTAGGGYYGLSVKAGSLTLDESFSPFVTATITIAHPGLSVMALIDPTATPRPTITLIAEDGNGSELVLTLNVTARQILASSNEVGINLANDEARLQDYSPTGPVDFGASQGSVRSICQQVLTRALGASTTVAMPFGADVAFPTYSDARNLIPNGSFEVSSGQWTANACTLSIATYWAQVGTYSLRIQPNSTSTSSYAAMSVPLTPGQTYTMSAYVRLGSAQGGTPNGDARRIQIVATISGAARIIARSNQPSNAVGVTLVSVTFTVPWNATDVTVRLLNGASNYAENSVYFDAVLLTEGNGLDTNGQPLTYFDGDTPDTAAYNYDWDQDAGLSSSTRTPLSDVDPDSLVWQPGTNGMEFLQPILQAVGRRLFQNEAGVWVLTDDNYRVPGQTRVAYGYNLYDATDLISRTAEQADGLPLFVDAVVLNYEWIASGSGVTKTASDVATTTGYSRPYIPDTIRKPFPGKGRAAYLLKRLRARTRQLDLKAAPDFDARPGQEAVITTLDGGVQTGYVDAITWDFSDNSMQVTTKGLLAVTASSVGNAAPTQTIGSQSATIGAYTN